MAEVHPLADQFPRFGALAPTQSLRDSALCEASRRTSVAIEKAVSRACGAVGPSAASVSRRRLARVEFRRPTLHDMILGLAPPSSALARIGTSFASPRIAESLAELTSLNATLRFREAIQKYLRNLLSQRNEQQHAKLADIAVDIIQKDEELAPLRDSQLAINVFLKYQARRTAQAPLGIYRPIIDGQLRLRAWPTRQARTLTLSARAMDRVWSSIASNLIEENLASCDLSVEHVERLFIDAVSQELRVTELVAPAFRDVPSTAEWVHRFSLHVGLSPPDRFNAAAPLGAGIERYGQGGLDGPLGRQEIRRYSRIRRDVGRVTKRLRCNWPCAFAAYGHEGFEDARYRWKGLPNARESDRSCGCARLGTYIPLERRRGRYCDTPRALMAAK